MTTFVKHQVPEMDASLIQRCVLCGAIITNYNGMVAPEGSQPAKGIPAGIVYVSKDTNPTVYFTTEPDSGEFIIEDCVQPRADGGANINKILELDVDTDRHPYLRVRQIAMVSYERERQPNPNVDIKDNLIILCEALGGTILQAERLGIEKPGQAMAKAIERLKKLYVDPAAVSSNFLAASDGSVLIDDMPDQK